MGYLVENDSDEWYKALEFMINNDGLRANMAQRANDYTWSQRMLRHCICQWKTALEKILGVKL